MEAPGETGRRYVPDPPLAAPEIVYTVVTELDDPQIKHWVWALIALVTLAMLWCLRRRLRGHNSRSVGDTRPPPLEKHVPKQDKKKDA